MSPQLAALSALERHDGHQAEDAANFLARLARTVDEFFRPKMRQIVEEGGPADEPLATPPVDDAVFVRDIFAELNRELADSPDEGPPEHEALDAASPADDAAPAEHPLAKMNRELRTEIGEEGLALKESAPALKEVIHAPAVLSIPPELRRKLDMMEVSYDSQVRALNELEILLEGGLPLGDDMPFIPEGYRRAHLPVASFGMLAKMIQRDERRQRALDALTLDSTRSPIVMPDLCLGSLRRLVSIVRKKMPVYSLFRDGDYETSQPMPFDPDAIRSKKDGRSWAENERLAKEALIKASVSRADFLPIILMDSDPQVLPFTLNKNRREARAHCDELGLHLSSLVNYLVAQALLHEKDRLDGNGHWTWLNSWGTSAQANLCGRWAPEHRALLLSQPTNLERSPSIGIRQELRVIF